MENKNRKLCEDCQYVTNNSDFICTNEDSDFYDRVVVYACELYKEYEGE